MAKNKNYVSVNSLSSHDRDKLRGAVREMVDSMLRVHAEKELQKEILTRMEDELGVEKKIVRRIAKAHYKASFNTEVADFNAFEEFYSTIFNSGSTP